MNRPPKADDGGLSGPQSLLSGTPGLPWREYLLSGMRRSAKLAIMISLLALLGMVQGNGPLFATLVVLIVGIVIYFAVKVLIDMLAE